MVDLTRFAFPQGRFPQRSNQGTSLTDVLGAFGQAAGRAEQQQLQRQDLERAIDQRRNLAEDLRIFTGEPLVVGGRVGPVEGGREVVDVAQPTEKNRAQALARIMSLDPELGKNLQNIEKINQELAVSADENSRANFNQSLKQAEISAKFGARAALQMKETPTLDGKRKLAKEAMTNIDALGLDPQFTEELKEDLQAIVNAENIDTANTKINGIIALGVPTADILSSIQEEQKQLNKDFTEQQNQATIGQGVIDLLGNRSLEEVPENLKFLKQQVDAINQLDPNNPNDRPRLKSRLVALGRTMQQFPKLFERLQQVGVRPELTGQVRQFQDAKREGIIPEDMTFEEFRELGRAETNITTNVVSDKGIEQLGKKQADFLVESFDTARNARNTLLNIKEAKSLIDSGIITGTGANFLTGFGNLLSSRLGYQAAEDPVANTQAFASTMGRQVGEIIKQFGAGTGLSDADREFAQKIVGQDITLNEEAIRKLMKINERAFKNVIESHNDIARQAKEKVGENVFFFDPEVQLPPDETASGLTDEEEEELRRLEEELGVE